MEAQWRNNPGKVELHWSVVLVLISFYTAAAAAAIAVGGGGGGCVGGSGGSAGGVGGGGGGGGWWCCGFDFAEVYASMPFGFASRHSSRPPDSQASAVCAT